MKHHRALVWTLLLIFGPAAAGLPLCAQLRTQAGFYSLEEQNFYFHRQSWFNRIAHRSSPARIWYTFQPADEEAATKPLFVFFNGGPGGSTSAGLFSANTAQKAVTLDRSTGRAFVADNPHSWTHIGNLLHIDARNTGFSYSQMDDPGNDSLRVAEFDSQNYNSFFDGAEFVRVLLRFLREHPELQGNRVVIVGESYGGIRSTVMLHLLLNYKSYADGSQMYQDPTLVREIQDHYDRVFPEFRGQNVPPTVIRRQFSHVVLVQPAVTRTYQRQIAASILESPGSIMYQLAEETGVPFLTWREQTGSTAVPSPNQVMNNIYEYLELIDRDPYFYAMNDGFFWGFFEASSGLLTRYESLNDMIGVDAASIPELYASSRLNGYKFRLTEDTASRIRRATADDPALRKLSLRAFQRQDGEIDMTSIFGLLFPWDRYYVDLNYDANAAFVLNRLTFSGYYDDLYYALSPLYGRMFLENTAWVDTFITNADYDIVVFSRALPEALALHSDYLQDSTHDTEGPQGARRPGQIHLYYRTFSVPGFDLPTRTIRFPRYRKSGHAVTLTEPGEILEDVIDWLVSTGVSAAGQGEER